MNDTLEDIYEPTKLYKKLIIEHRQNIDLYIEDMIKESSIEVEKNRETVKAIKNLEFVLNKDKKKQKSLKLLRGFFITFIVLMILGSIYLFYSTWREWEVEQKKKIIYSLIGLLLIIISGLIFSKINININALILKINVLEKEIKIQYDEAWGQMESFNNLYDWDSVTNLFSKTFPQIKFDKFLSHQKYSNFLDEGYNISNKNETILELKSGDLLGNDFIIYNKLIHEMKTKVYTGSITISWTENYTDLEGENQTITKTQVLTASVVKPFPEFYEHCKMIYQTEAAPNLSFKRHRNEKVRTENNKKYQKSIDKQIKKAEKFAEKAIKRSQSYNLMNNSEFEVLFNCKDRDDEKEFRMLFNSVGQHQIIELIHDNQCGFGDDFIWEKDKKIHSITSDHLQSDNFIISANPEFFISYEFEKSVETFKKYNINFFKHIFFQFAPILSTPILFQFAKEKSENEVAKTATPYQEMFSNSFDKALISHPDSITENINKTTLLESKSDLDYFEVISNGYGGIKRCDYIPVFGGDGETHMVAVDWIEYYPVSQTTKIAIKKTNASRNQYISSIQNGKIFEAINANVITKQKMRMTNGLLAYIVATEEIDNDNIFSEIDFN